MNGMDAKSLIDALQLEPLPSEGGYFRRIHTHPATVPGTERPLSSSIYYLLTPDTFSALHRLDMQETYHFHGGDAVEMLLLHPDGTGEKRLLGAVPACGEAPFTVVPAGVWQGSRLAPSGSAGYALFSLCCCPGFVWEGFELGPRAALTAQWPAFTGDIAALTRN